MNAREKVLYQADFGRAADLSVQQTAELRNWIVEQMAVEELILARYMGVFPNFVWTDARAAIDLMNAEIITTRKECADEQSRRKSLHAIITQVCDLFQCGTPDKDGLECAPLLAGVTDQNEHRKALRVYQRRFDSILGSEIEGERAAQDKQWGGPSHDNQHERFEWVGFMRKFLKRAEEFGYMGAGLEQIDSYEANLIKVAALCVAAVQASRR